MTIAVIAAVDRRFEGLILLFDTPIVLGVLGLKGESIEAARTSTLNLAHQLGAEHRPTASAFSLTGSGDHATT